MPSVYSELYSFIRGMCSSGYSNFQVGFSRPLSGDSITVELHRGHRTSYHRGTRFTAQLDESPRYPHQLQLKVHSLFQRSW